MRNRRISRTLAALAASLLWCAQARSEADGPDYYRVVGVAAGDVVVIRAGPDADTARLGAIPPGADGVRNLGCRGGLTFAEWEKASEGERAAAAKNRWCRIEFGGTEGWVAARFLAEGSAPRNGASVAAVPKSPGEGGPRNWRVAAVSGRLNLRDAPSTGGRVIGRYAPGTILDNLGCRDAEGRVWCDVRESGGGPRGYVAAEFLVPATGDPGG